MKHANVAVFVPHVGCKYRCSFCDQKMITGQSLQPTPQDVRRAADTALRTLGPEARQAEIAFFGGSFTAIDADYRRQLLETAALYVRDGQFAGIRLSTRPDAITEPILQELCAYGVTTVELGAQSMCNRVLQHNGRGHTAAQVCSAAEQIRAHGLRLGLQMMTGLPGDSPEGARYTALCFAALKAEEVRIYPTIVLPGTQLAAWYRAGTYRPETLEESVTLCTQLLEFFTEKQIRVIRLGLHASPELEQKRLAGPWHPAFRELCESRLWLFKMQRLLQGKPCGSYRFCAPAACMSQVIGHKKANIAALAAQGYRVLVQPGTCFSLLST